MNPDTEWQTSCLTAEDEKFLRFYGSGECAIDFAGLIRECIEDELSSLERVLDRCVDEDRDLWFGYFDDVAREHARFIHKCVINRAFAAEVLGRLDPQA